MRESGEPPAPGTPRAATRPQRRGGGTPLWRMVRYWGVVAAWMVIISLFSTEPFSAANTNRYLDPILRFFFPHLTPAGFALAHSLIRKSAHFTEFFVLGSLTYWACRRGREPHWRAAWMLQAVGLAVLYSVIDEAHQAFVPNRTPSLVDSSIDTLGALASQVAIYVHHLMRRRNAALGTTGRMEAK
jgi:VanZ family protein